MSIRDAFVARFGEDAACAIEDAAVEHRNGVNDCNLGSDPFKWALLICIGYDCISREEYRAYHGITVGWLELCEWITAEADLGSHDGDCDYLALLSGAYDFLTEGTPPS